MKHNNQIVVGHHGRRDVEEEAQPLGSVWGPVTALIRAEIQTTTKIKNIIHLGLRGPLFDNETQSQIGVGGSGRRNVGEEA
jgi:hypothetical protein